MPHPAHRPPRDGRVAGEPAERAAIFRQQVGAELTNASLRSHATDLLEEARAEPESLPAVLAAEGLRELKYRFDFEGAKVLVNF